MAPAEGGWFYAWRHPTHAWHWPPCGCSWQLDGGRALFRTVARGSCGLPEGHAPHREVARREPIREESGPFFVGKGLPIVAGGTILLEEGVPRAEDVMIQVGPAHWIWIRPGRGGDIDHYVGVPFSKRESDGIVRRDSFLEGDIMLSYHRSDVTGDDNIINSRRMPSRLIRGLIARPQNSVPETKSA